MSSIEDAGGFGEVTDLPGQLGHNKPPGTLQASGDGLSVDLERKHKILFDRARALIAAEARIPPITDEESDSKATEFVKQIQACAKELEALRVGELAPYDQAWSHIHSTFRALIDKLARPDRKSLPALKERVEARQTAYKIEVEARERRIREEAAAKARAIEEEARRKREAEEAAARAVEEERRRVAREAEEKANREAQEAALFASRKRNAEAREKAEAEAKERQRIADEAAKKRREEDDKAAADRRTRDDAARVEADKAAESRAQAERQAAAPAAGLTRAHGAHGGVSSLATYWDFRDLSREKLDLESLREHIPLKALDSAVRAFIKAGGRKLTGVVIEQVKETKTR